VPTRPLAARAEPLGPRTNRSSAQFAAATRLTACQHPPQCSGPRPPQRSSARLQTDDRGVGSPHSSGLPGTAKKKKNPQGGRGARSFHRGRLDLRRCVKPVPDDISLISPGTAAAAGQARPRLPGDLHDLLRNGCFCPAFLRLGCDGEKQDAAQIPAWSHPEKCHRSSATAVLANFCESAPFPSLTCWIQNRKPAANRPKSG